MLLLNNISENQKRKKLLNINNRNEKEAWKRAYGSL